MNDDDLIKKAKIRMINAKAHKLEIENMARENIIKLERPDDSEKEEQPKVQDIEGFEKRVVFTGLGKTTYLLDQCAKNNGRLVVATMAQARFMADRAAAEGYDIRHPITYEQFLKRPLGSPKGGRVCIDNAEMLLDYIANKNGFIVDDISADLVPYT